MYDADISFQEVVYRLSNPRWVASHSLRFVREVLASFVPSQFNHLFRKVSPITMVSYARLHGLYQATRYVVQNSIPGEFVECGVAKGGSAALVGLTLLQMRAKRDFPGLFQDTVQGAAIQSISLLHLDGDWYESVKTCLHGLYDKVSPGGVIQFDDYGHWAGARKAVDEFMKERGISTHLHRLDFSGRQLIKPLQHTQSSGGKSFKS